MEMSAYSCSTVEISRNKVTRCNLCRSPEDAGSVYVVEQTEDSLSTSNTDSSGKKLDKDLKPRSMKGDMSEPLSQYDLNSYQSKTKIKFKKIQIKKEPCLVFISN